MVASSLLVLTTGRQYCERFVERAAGKMLECPIDFPQLMYYQLWHERTHASASAKWLREQIKSVAASLRPAPANPGLTTRSIDTQKRRQLNATVGQCSQLPETAFTAAAGRIARPAERLFKLREHNTNVRTEVGGGGLTTFLDHGVHHLRQPQHPLRGRRGPRRRCSSPPA